MSTAGVRDATVQVVVSDCFGASTPSSPPTSCRPTRRSSARSASRRALARLAPDDPEAMPQLPPQQYAAGRRRACDATAPTSSAEERRDRPRSRRSEPCARRAVTSTPPAYLRGWTRRQRARQQHRAVRLSSRHERRTTRSPCAPQTAPARGGPAPSMPTARIDRLRAASAVAPSRRRALSRNPVAVEPGRYTVILEPQAVGDLVQLRRRSTPTRAPPTKGARRSSKQGGGNKIGEKIVDERVTHVLRSVRPDRCSPSRSTATGSRYAPAGVDRERRAQDAALRSLLGEEAGEAAAPVAPNDVVPDERRHHRASRR